MVFLDSFFNAHPFIIFFINNVPFLLYKNNVCYILKCVCTVFNNKIELNFSFNLI